LKDNLTLKVLGFTEESLSTKLDALLYQISTFVKEKMASSRMQSVCRVYVSSFQDLVVALHKPPGTMNYEEEVTLLGRFLLRLKRIVRDSRVMVVFSVNPTMLHQQSMLLLEQFCDSVLSVDSFAGKAHVVPYEFKEFLGFFTVHKLSQCGQLAPYQPLKGTKFGIKRDRRKLHIEPLHLPPEESRAFGSSGCSPDTKDLAPVTSKAFQQVGRLEKSSSLTHNHSHDHALESAMPANELELNRPVSASQKVVETSAVPKPKNSLAAALAIARESRLASKESSAKSFKPVSISKPMSQQSPSLDF
jgi:hypothetical protein